MRKKVYLILKLVAGILLFYILYSHLESEFVKFNWLDLREKITNVDSLLCFTIVIMLMMINWMLESLKWKIILSKSLIKIDFFNSFRSVLSGIAFGNLAPGRATEFAGKILFLPKDIRASATYLHFVNGMIQLLITIVPGTIAFILLSGSGENNFGSGLSIYALIISSTLLLGLAIFLYRPTRFYRLLQKNEKIRKLMSEKIEIPGAVVINLAILSVLRYLVFSFQFYILIRLFFDSTPIYEISIGICLYYLLTTIIPMFSLIEAFLRGGVAVLIFTPIEHNSIHIFTASTFLWIINIVMPSIAGYFFFLFYKSENNHTVNNA